jgi:uncharacterized protein YndB with AHSA1/START domain
MNARTHLQVDIADREVTLTRDFAFPRERVWRAWTDAAAIARWFGPHGFTTDVVANDLRVGGDIHYVMRRDGVDYPVRGRVVEIVPPEKLVMTDDNSCMPAEWLAEYAADEIARGESIESVTTMCLEDLGGGRTRLRLTTRMPGNKLRDGLVASGMADGWGESFEKLDTLLADSKN